MLFIKKNINNTLTPSEKYELDTNIQMSELTNALSAMKKGKTPGSTDPQLNFTVVSGTK